MLHYFTFLLLLQRWLLRVARWLLELWRGLLSILRRIVKMGLPLLLELLLILELALALQAMALRSGGRARACGAPTRRTRGSRRRRRVKDFQLAGVRDVVIDTTLRHEFHGNVMAQANLGHNGEPSHQAVDGALDEAVKEKLATYADDYNARNFFFCPPS